MTTQLRIDRIPGKVFSFAERNVQGNYIIFEINETMGRISLVTDKGAVIAQRRSGKSPDFKVDNEEHMKRVANYLLVDLSRNYRGFI